MLLPYIAGLCLLLHTESIPTKMPLAPIITKRTASSTEGTLLPRRGVLGLPFQPVPATLQSTHHLRANQGVLAGKPTPGFTAEQAGIQEGDIVLEINGKEIIPATFAETIRGLTAGKDIRVKLLRDGKPLIVSAPLVERPRDPGTDKYDVVYSSVNTVCGRMRTIVSKPKTPGKHPALLFIQGYTPISYDVNLNSQNLVAPILFDFANNGFVTLRVEKPGVGDSEGGPFAKVDYTSELDIYRQALKQLKSLDYVDADSIIIFGHSMGGAFGPMIACESPVRGIIVYGIAARTWNEYLSDTLRHQNLLAGASYSQVDESVRTVGRIFHQVFNEGKTTEQVKKEHPELAPVVDEAFPGGLFNGKTSTFWGQLVATNFASYWEKCNAHVLAIHGKSDFVSYSPDHQLVADIVNRVHPGWGQYEEAPNSDHLFLNYATEAESMKNLPGAAFSPVFLNRVRDWVSRLPKANAMG